MVGTADQNWWGTTLEWVLRILVGELIIHHTYFTAFSQNVNSEYTFASTLFITGANFAKNIF